MEPGQEDQARVEGRTTVTSPQHAAARALAAAVLLLASGPGYAQTRSFAAPEAPASTASYGPDLMPRDVKGRADLLRAAAFDATIYGMSAYLQYQQLYRQVFDRSSTNHTGFNQFAHERNLAGPDYATFKVPNTDTLYSTAWIDLSKGPVEVQIPATNLRYFTLNIFDMFGNPSNLSNRTIGFGGGRFLLVPPNWHDTPPAGVKVYQAATVQLWILMRVFAQSDREVRAARDFQEAVKILPPADDAASVVAEAPTPPVPAPGVAAYLRTLDYLLRVNGFRAGEEALVSRFRPLGVLTGHPFDPAAVDPATLAAIEGGYGDALALIAISKSQLGETTGTGWMKVNKGEYGFNYLRRSVTNTAGLGANVREENASFTTFADGGGKPLDGAAFSYTLHLPTPPPVDAFWSVTLYDAKSFALSPNPLHRYLVSDRTRGLTVRPDGSIDIEIQHAPGKGANWLPAPAGPFFVVMRAYGPKPAMLNGQWLPPAITVAGSAR